MTSLHAAIFPVITVMAPVVSRTSRWTGVYWGQSLFLNAQWKNTVNECMSDKPTVLYMYANITCERVCACVYTHYFLHYLQRCKYI